MKYMAIINADEKPVSCEFIGCNGNVAPYLIGTTTNIKTLEQEPCEDVIDRAEAMTEIMMFAGNVKFDEEDIYIKVSDAVQLLRELPPVNSQPKTGKWIRVDKDKCKCDQCEVISFIAMYPNGDKNYCPNCGAKMQEVEDGNDD